EVASVLKDVFHNQMGNSGASTTVGGFPGFFSSIRAFGQTNPNDPASNTLSIGVDDRTNSLIVACPEVLFKKVKQIVEEMDDVSRMPPVLMSVSDLDPTLVQQAIDVSQGRLTVRRGFSSLGSGFGRGGFGQGGFGQGGFGRGGFGQGG